MGGEDEGRECEGGEDEGHECEGDVGEGGEGNPSSLEHQRVDLYPLVDGVGELDGVQDGHGVFFGACSGDGHDDIVGSLEDLVGFHKRITLAVFGFDRAYQCPLAESVEPVACFVRIASFL